MPLGFHVPHQLHLDALLALPYILIGQTSHSSLLACDMVPPTLLLSGIIVVRITDSVCKAQEQGTRSNNGD